MAGDWIKMRSDLGTHPKVVRMASALKADKLRILGGLLSVWSLFDMHSEDGRVEGYSFSAVDELIAFPGFCQAMSIVGWLDEEGESLVVPRFDEHNGQSAKRRAMDAERKRVARKSAEEADKERTREEKRREEKNHTQLGEPEKITPAQVSLVMRKYTIPATPANPSVIALAEQGISLETLEAACKETREAKPNEAIAVNYIAKKLESWARQANAIAVQGAAIPEGKVLNKQEALEARNRVIAEQAAREYSDGTG